MDEKRFDHVARIVATNGLGRRRVLAALTAGALGTLLERSDSAAACLKEGKECRRSSQCCDGGVCKKKRGKPGRCRCDGPQFKDCDGDGRCEDLSFDDANCGSCGRACTDPEICFGAVCCRPNGNGCLDVCGAGTSCAACCTGICGALGQCGV